MKDINAVVLFGRLTRDAELKHISSGTALLSFSIAVNKRKKQGDQWIDEGHYFDCRLWGKLAESLAQKMEKGKQVGIAGSLVQERWESDGNKKSRVLIEVEDIQLVGGSSGDHQKPPARMPTKQQTQDDDYFDDDVPF